MLVLGAFVMVLADQERVGSALSAESLGWPEASGRVTAARLTSSYSRTSGRCYHARIRYRYSVSGKDFVGTEINYASDCGETVARELLRRYPVGADVGVHYRPADPSVAVLEPGTWHGRRSFTAIAALSALPTLLGLAGLVAYAVSVRRYRRSRTTPRA